MPATTLHVHGRCLVWPENLWQQAPAAWLAIRTKPRTEKRQMEALQRAGIAGCLFVEERVVRYAKSTVTRSLPLLPGWVFAAVGVERRSDLFAQGFALSVEVAGQAQQVQRELLALANLLAAARGPVVFRPELTIGQEVHITQGTFAGCYGVIERRLGVCSLVVRLTTLGLSAVAELPADWVERHTQPPRPAHRAE